jgi:hypothetical protein
MAIAGNSYANVPVIIRGSLEDPEDFNPKVPALVVTSWPSAAQTAVPPVTILRNTLADPPVLTTAAPSVTAAPCDPRWFNPNPVTVIANPQAPPAVSAATPGPVVVAAPPPWPATVQAFTARNTLRDPPVLTTPGPVTVAAPADPRWFAARGAVVLSAPQAPAPVPGPLVVTSQPPWPGTVQAFITRNTLADPPVLTTPAPVVAAGPADPRWFAVSPARIAAGAAAAPAPPAAPAEPGGITVTDLLAGQVYVSGLTAANVTVTDQLAGTITVTGP